MLDKDFGKDVQLLAVASNCFDTHPQDGPEYLTKQKLENGWNFPYLLDLDQSLFKEINKFITFCKKHER